MRTGTSLGAHLFVYFLACWFSSRPLRTFSFSAKSMRYQVSALCSPQNRHHLHVLGNTFSMLKNTHESRVQVFATKLASKRHTLKHFALSIMQLFKGFLGVCIHLFFRNVHMIIRIMLQDKMIYDISCNNYYYFK